MKFFNLRKRVEELENDIKAIRRGRRRRKEMVDKRLDQMECKHDHKTVIDRRDPLSPAPIGSVMCYEKRYCEKCEDCGKVLAEYNDEKRYRYAEVHILVQKKTDLEYEINEKKREMEEWEESCQTPSKT